jgi:hypothetical protein
VRIKQCYPLQSPDQSPEAATPESRSREESVPDANAFEAGSPATADGENLEGAASADRVCSQQSAHFRPNPPRRPHADGPGRPVNLGVGVRTQSRGRRYDLTMYRVTVMVLMTLVVVAAGVAAYWVASVAVKWL